MLLFRGQTLSDDDLIAFSRRFGELDLAPIQENGRRFVEGHPEIYVVSNVIENGVAIGSLGAGEAVWHTDMSYLDDPPKASMLYAIEVPPAGGNTGFTNMYRAYEALPDGAEAAHRGAAGEARWDLQQRRLCAAGRDADRRSARGAGDLPSDRVHASGDGAEVPVSRAAAQRVYRGAGAGGVRGAAGRGLEHATRDELTWYNKWRVGDVVLWDNRCTMHRRDPFDAVEPADHAPHADEG